MHDVIYIIRNDIVECEELRYSLRTIDNMPHGKVWIAGGCPEKIKPDVYLNIEQKGATKWERSTYTIRAICESSKTPETFWLFNDDFFILEKIKEIPAIYNGTLEEHIKNIGVSRYVERLKQTAAELKRRGYSTRNYAVHAPLLLHKDKALRVLDEFKGWPMFRCLYGNRCCIGGVDMPDVKIRDINRVPKDGAQLVSTSNDSFHRGAVGKYIRARFTEPSRFEV